MLRVAGASSLGTCSSCPPKSDAGKAVLGQLLQPAGPGSEPSLAGASHRLLLDSSVRYIRKAGDKAQKWWLEGPALCLPQRCCRAQFVGWFLKGCGEDFPQGNPQDFMPCGGSCLIGCARGSLPRPCTSHWRLFPLFVSQDVPWKNGFGISVHHWDTFCDSGLFCIRHCPQDVC